MPRSDPSPDPGPLPELERSRRTAEAERERHLAAVLDAHVGQVKDHRQVAEAQRIARERPSWARRVLAAAGVAEPWQLHFEVKP